METILSILGGLGLFLLGLLLMTDGLKGLAGAQLRRMLTGAVRGPLSGAMSGAVVTAMVQSSSATIVTTIGLVSAGLLTFQHALGVVFGAAVGTTATTWLVTVLGFRIPIGTAAMPLIFLGTMIRLLGRDRMASGGLALAGFGVLFVGIGILASGMSGFAERFSPEDMPPATLAGRALLVGIGIAMTVLAQSSSVAVAATVAALHAGAIDLDQAAALVVGQSIGTAVTSVIAAIGATTPARRTAVAHILFTTVTGILAFLLLPLLAPLAEWFAEPEQAAVGAPRRAGGLSHGLQPDRTCRAASAGGSVRAPRESARPPAGSGADAASRSLSGASAFRRRRGRPPRDHRVRGRRRLGGHGPAARRFPTRFDALGRRRRGPA